MTSQTQPPVQQRLRRMLLPLMALAIASMSLTACGPAHEYGKPITHTTQDALSILNAGAMPQQRSAPIVSVVDSAWIGGDEFRLDSGARFPARFNQIQFQTEHSSAIQEIAEQITRQYGVPAIVVPSRFISAAQLANSQRESGRGTGSLPPPPDGTFTIGTGGPDPLSQNQARDTGTPDRRVDVNYAGSLAGLADTVSGLFDYAWEFREGVIRFLPEVTRVYNIQTTPDESEFSTALSNDVESGAGGSGGGANATNGSNTADARVEGKFKIWDELDKSIQKTVGPRGDVTLSRAMSSITITASPSVHSQVQQVIEGYNETLSRQIAITVQVITVTLSKTDSLAFDIDGFFQSMSSRYRGVFSGVRPVIDPNAAGLNGTILQTGGQLGRFRGSDVLIQSLAEKGDVTVDYDRTLAAMNGQVAPFQNVRRRTYIQEITQSTAANVGTQITAKQGTINTGFTFMVLPRIMPGEQVQIRYSLNIASLLGLTTVNIGGNILQQPDLQVLGDSNLAMMRSGEMLVISGYKQNTVEAQGRGLTSPDNPLLGGSGRGSKASTLVAVLITPTIVNPRAATAAVRASDVRVQ
jgi:type IVB pilus formation R64 PilN family outer membrane protein